MSRNERMRTAFPPGGPGPADSGQSAEGRTSPGAFCLLSSVLWPLSSDQGRAEVAPDHDGVLLGVGARPGEVAGDQVDPAVAVQVPRGAGEVIAGDPLQGVADEPPGGDLLQEDHRVQL